MTTTAEHDEHYHVDTPTVEQVDHALRLLGYQPCEEHAPADPAERRAGLLATILVLAQYHISQTPVEQAETVDRVYHNMRHHVLPEPCPCGRDHSPPADQPLPDREPT